MRFRFGSEISSRMDTVTFDAPAKVNLSLRVLFRRPDGYHEIDSLLCPIGLADTVRVRRLDTSEVQVTCPGREELSGVLNLAHRAATAFLAHRPGLGTSIEITKRIPVASGLGGGSSDAAATLLALQKLTGSPLGPEELLSMATALGADVPFFLMQRPCRAQGTGERLAPVRLPPFWLVLALPPFGQETRRVYENLKYSLTSVRRDDTQGRSERGLNSSVVFDPAWSFEQLTRGLANDLQPTGEMLHAEIEGVRHELARAGAAGALMSGSGPSVFGLFPDEAAAAGALGRLRQRRSWTYLMCRALN